MPERIYKLQPNRTLQLRGFDDLGAAAALHSATASSFKVSGVFRDAADFAVLVLHDADNFYEHPRLKYLPDFDFDGLTLQCDMHYSGLMPLDSPKFPTISWPFLDVIREDGSILEGNQRIRLFDHAVQVGGTYIKAGSSFTIVESGLKEFDSVTLWYLNKTFEYLVPRVECAFAFSGSGVPGTIHWVDVDGVRYQTTEVEGDTNTSIAARLAAALAAAPKVTATLVAPGNQIDLRNRADDGSQYVVAASSGGSFTLNGVGLNTVAASLASKINNGDYSGALFGLNAVATGATVNIQAARPGVDGNYVTMYATSKNSRLTTAQSTVQFSGGSSDATWRVTLDFAALGIPQVRQMWLTFAPPLQYGGPIPATEWEATFTNWTLIGPESKRMLQVAGLDSVRVEEDDPWCSYSGDWEIRDQTFFFFSGGFAKRTSVENAQVTVKYACAVQHDVYIGTVLHASHGKAAIRLDGGSETELDCAHGFTAPQAPVVARRKVRANVPAGEHTVTIRLTTPGLFFYFDFLEAALPSDVPDALPAVATLSPALDYSTDHAYKLSPARILWNFDSWALRLR